MLPTDLNEEDGLSKLYSKLDKLFKEDENKVTLETYDKFESYSRPFEMTIADYLIEFDRMAVQLKLHKIILPEPVLAYRVLRSANLTNDHEKLIRVTVSELTLKSMAKNAVVTDQEFLTMLEEIPSSCETCLRNKKVQPRPVVGFSLASRFNEWVALDMKDVKGNKILHLIYLFSKYSVAVRVPNKESLTIINIIFKYWVSIIS